MIRAVVFDFDGLILDTESPVLRSWQEAFEQAGCPPLALEEWSQELGTAGALDLVALLRARATRPFDEAALLERRRARRDELLAREEVRPGVCEWLDEAGVLGIPVAIASSSAADWVRPLLERHALGDRFAHVACCGPGLRAKPEPDTYLAACAALGIDPGDALAVEDSPHGITAAKRAGLRCVAVPNGLTVRLDVSRADARLPSLRAATLRDVLTRLG
jgi:HAD superfamily hydrolase (TIGR01509 family)